MFPKDCARIVPVYVFADALGAPRKGPHNAIIILFCVRDFSGTHPFPKQSEFSRD